MAKKNKKNKNKDVNESMERYFKYTLEKNYEGILEEINELNASIKKADKKDKKKLEKMKKSSNITIFEINDSAGFKVRKKTAKMFKDSKFIDSLIHCLTHADSLLSLLKRAISVLIISLLSVDCIRRYITPNILNKINLVFAYTKTC